jgi:CheY-like chemotaxis protein
VSRPNGVYSATRLTFASALAHVCTAGNHGGFWAAAFRASRLTGIRPPISNPAPGYAAPPSLLIATGVTAGRGSFPSRGEFPASFHAIGPSLLQTELVRLGDRMRCVIVDDNRDFLDAATRLLEHQGISVVAVASSSAEGLQCVENLRPDVTLVDIDLGDESGFELVERLHRNGFGAEAPTILISTHAEEDFAELVAASPALAFIPKAALSGAAIRDALGVAG